MKRLQFLRSALVGGASAMTLASSAIGKEFDVPRGDLAVALNTYMQQAGVLIVYSDDVVRGHKSQGAKGDLTELAALTQILRGTGFTTKTLQANAIGIVSQQSAPVRLAQASKAPAAPPQTSLETVVVTAQHKSENIQTVPISITALSQQQLTDRQIAGGPDLLKSVPNMDFTKTNFSGYNIELRGIGTQAISVTTDPAVAVAFNDTPFIRNHFFEQEFYDLSDVEVLRGPQGTLYGRNATAGVVDLKSALPTDSYEAMLSADMGNYSNRRLEGMLNIPIVGDTLDLRIAGEWTKRDGYTFNEETDQSVDGRDLWSGRVTIGWKPTSDLQTYFIWEHFSEDDDRLRSGKQLCKTDPGPTEVMGVPVPPGTQPGGFGRKNIFGTSDATLSQGCEDTSLYSPNAFEMPYGPSLPYVEAGELAGVVANLNPYQGTTQSTNLRVIDSALTPSYRAKNDTLEFNATYQVTPALTLTSQTGYNNDILFSFEDFNRFNTAPGFFGPTTYGSAHGASIPPLTTLDPTTGTYFFCDPQLGCSDRLVGADVSDEHAWQLSQEFRLTSNFSGPLNFSGGGNYLHYETEENYYVFFNTLTALAKASGGNLTPDNSNCLPLGFNYGNPANGGGTPTLGACPYIDTNPIGQLNNEGHNYFLSQNPYVLNSYALFGEAYYQVFSDLKLTGGLRWTDDQKHFLQIPSWVVGTGWGYPVSGVVDQQWDKLTGRAVANWTPNLAFTDQTLIYASYAHGYKAGGANPPGAVLTTAGNIFDSHGSDIPFPTHPLTFKPESVDAFELGTKNEFLGNALTLNGDIFYYEYKDYQVSEIVDRSAINLNFSAKIGGAELETTWEPAPGLKFSFASGYEETRIDNGQYAIDLMDRTASNPNWMVVKPFVTQASNCILPVYVVAAMLAQNGDGFPGGYCEAAYNNHLDPITGLSYVANPVAGTVGTTIPAGYAGFDPLAGTAGDLYIGQNISNGINYGPVPNNGEGFAKSLGGNQLPNAPHFTTSLTAEYTIPAWDGWAATLHGDFYWQSQSWARVFEDPIDKIHGYSNVNLSLILSSDNGWQVMGYVKNIFNVTAITGTFLNSDDTGLTTNVFLTDPRLYGVRVTKQLDQNDGFWGSDNSGYEFFTNLFADTDKGTPPLWIEVGGNFDLLTDDHQAFNPPFMASIPRSLGSQLSPQKGPGTGLDWETKIAFEPDGTDWVFSVSARYGRTSRDKFDHHQTNVTKIAFPSATRPIPVHYQTRYANSHIGNSESHAILDFMAGKNVGLGSLGWAGDLVVNGGARYAAFESKSGFDINAIPDSAEHTTGPKYHYHSYHGQFAAERSFHGIGPALNAEASSPFAGNGEGGEWTIDWGVNGAVLFGREKVIGSHQTGGAYYCNNGVGGALAGRTAPCPAKTANAVQRFYYNNGNSLRPLVSSYQHTKTINRSRMVTVPNIGAFVGLSMKYNNAKISFGYRADEFFGAMDGGIDSYKSENRGFFGPYASLSIGFGG